MAQAVEQVMFALMMTTMQNHCVPRCLVKPGDSLTRSEKECLATCQDKYLEAFNLAFQEAGNRISQMDQKQ